MNTCSNCAHFLQFVGENNGHCYHSPPQAYKDGTTSQPPVVKANRRACGQIKPLPPGEPAAVKVKEHVPSHGLVVQPDKKPKPKPTKPEHIPLKDRPPMADRIPVQQP